MGCLAFWKTECAKAVPSHVVFTSKMRVISAYDRQKRVPSPDRTSFDPDTPRVISNEFVGYNVRVLMRITRRHPPGR